MRLLEIVMSAEARNIRIQKIDLCTIDKTFSKYGWELWMNVGCFLSWIVLTEVGLQHFQKASKTHPGLDRYFHKIKLYVRLFSANANHEYKLNSISGIILDSIILTEKIDI